MSKKVRLYLLRFCLLCWCKEELYYVDIKIFRYVYCKKVSNLDKDDWGMIILEIIIIVFIDKSYICFLVGYLCIFWFFFMVLFMYLLR